MARDIWEKRRAGKAAPETGGRALSREAQTTLRWQFRLLVPGSPFHWQRIVSLEVTQLSRTDFLIAD